MGAGPQRALPGRSIDHCSIRPGKVRHHHVLVPHNILHLDGMGCLHQHCSSLCIGSQSQSIGRELIKKRTIHHSIHHRLPGGVAVVLARNLLGGRSILGPRLGSTSPYFPADAGRSLHRNDPAAEGVPT